VELAYKTGSNSHIRTLYFNA